MTGHDALLKLRRAGRKPACVWVLDDDHPASAQIARDWHLEPNPYAGKVFAHIRLVDTDIPESLDFRPLIGLQVHMTCSRGPDRAKRVFDSLAAAEPVFLIAVQGGEVWTHGGINGGNFRR
jgi:hypothetical protein